jgi:hypothetical protein
MPNHTLSLISSVSSEKVIPYMHVEERKLMYFHRDDGLLGTLGAPNAACAIAPNIER